VGAVAEPGLSFAGLLRQLRAEAELTQEELAEAAGLSPRSVSDLERGITRTARLDTARLLAGALGLAGPVRVAFVAAARGQAPPATVLAARPGGVPGAFAAAAVRGLPRDIAAFTGRQAELGHLVGALARMAADGGVVGIHAIDGMAGVGKTAFAVHTAHRLTGTFPDGQFFLPLHAHTAGQRPVEPADALASLLLTAGVPAPQIPPDVAARAARWRDAVAGKKILLLLDDAASHEQVRPLLPGTPGSLVLVTSRRRLAALEDAAVISLDTLPPEEAGALLARLAARPGLRPRDAAVGEITRLCGYLPLAIGMIAGQLRHHPAWSAAGLAADLATARDRLAVLHAENVSVAAALDLSYADLTEGAQRLFRRLGLVPGPSFDGYAAAALDGTTLGQARDCLDELYDQHLITEPAPGRYQLHDLVREHARARTGTDDPAETGAAAGRLLDYYVHTAAAADASIATLGWRRPPPGDPPADVPDLSAAGQAAAWLETERANLHAAADYAATSGRPVPAVAIPEAMAQFLRNRGHWDQAVALHQTALIAARQAGDRLGELRSLSELALLAMATGDYPGAAASYRHEATLTSDINGQDGHRPSALAQLGLVQVLMGDYRAADASLREALTLAQGHGDRHSEAWVLQNLGFAQERTGDYAAGAANLARALDLWRGLGNRAGEGQALNNLGTLQTLTGDYPAAGANIRQALQIWRDVGDQLPQAQALNDLGVVQQLTGDYPAAAASHQQALEVFCDLGARLGQAEALNRLGELSLRLTDTSQARDQHTQALAIAQALAVPFEEARALEGIGRSHLHDGNTSQAAAHLRQALAIYQRIGNPGAQRIQDTLRHHGLSSRPPATVRARRDWTGQADTHPGRRS
jgi:tetratricopeptide (TPR) repeat protein/transcriptional regulator with XRE-family HTH domain